MLDIDLGYSEFRFEKLFLESKVWILLVILLINYFFLSKVNFMIYKETLKSIVQIEINNSVVGSLNWIVKRETKIPPRGNAIAFSNIMQGRTTLNCSLLKINCRFVLKPMEKILSAKIIIPKSIKVYFSSFRLY